MGSGVSRVLDDDGQASSFTFQIGAMEAADPQPSPTREPMAHAARLAPIARPAPVASARSASDATVLTAAQLISQLKARLRVVEREIRARKTLESERGQLKRLIDAALTERDNVRRLRSAG
jgi:hypothetical protein